VLRPSQNVPVFSMTLQAKYAVREAAPDDVQAIAALMRLYMTEAYHDAWRGSVPALLKDGFGARFRTLLASLEAQPVGILAWEKSYDLHHCLTGGHLLDVYVAPAHRFRGLAVQLISTASRLIYADGGAYIKGGALDSGSGARLYGRFAMAFGNDYILGGRAFRHLATLPDLSIRQLARCMPEKRWNFEP
jgi:GNAT superfamily N-acetyltransferase